MCVCVWKGIISISLLPECKYLVMAIVAIELLYCMLAIDQCTYTGYMQ